ncbi:hypothetical protein R3P38DRAFT_3255058 [Favolaschia claudopus]|uniref:Uncharacterized protein n=1 Tax=Favolaschia claudopus TaxID=2862362 RepID=A0AAW0DJL4_9AGAR
MGTPFSRSRSRSLSLGAPRAWLYGPYSPNGEIALGLPLIPVVVVDKDDAAAPPLGTTNRSTTSPISSLSRRCTPIPTLECGDAEDDDEACDSLTALYGACAGTSLATALRLSILGLSTDVYLPGLVPVCADGKGKATFPREGDAGSPIGPREGDPGKAVVCLPGDIPVPIAVEVDVLIDRRARLPFPRTPADSLRSHTPPTAPAAHSVSRRAGAYSSDRLPAPPYSPSCRLPPPSPAPPNLDGGGAASNTANRDDNSASSDSSVKVGVVRHSATATEKRKHTSPANEKRSSTPHSPTSANSPQLRLPCIRPRHKERAGAPQRLTRSFFRLSFSRTHPLIHPTPWTLDLGPPRRTTSSLSRYLSPPPAHPRGARRLTSLAAQPQRHPIQSISSAHPNAEEELARHPHPSTSTRRIGRLRLHAFEPRPPRNRESPPPPNIGLDAHTRRTHSLHPPLAAPGTPRSPTMPSFHHPAAGRRGHDDDDDHDRGSG